MYRHRVSHWFGGVMLVWAFTTAPVEGQPTADALKPVRIAGRPKAERVFPGSSHSHPGVCVTKKGTVLVVHYVENAGLVLIARSTDGGRTWGESVPVPDVNCKCYPGALTSLSDGRVVVT